MDQQTKQMLSSIGIDSIEELFSDIPDSVREGLSLPDGLGEHGTILHIDSILSKGKIIDPSNSFLGHGVYNHFIPAIVRRMLNRG